MKIESQKATVQKSSAEIVAFISDIENFKTLMPESINKFEVTNTDSFRFSLQGMPEFELKKTSVSDTQIEFTSASEKTPFTLKLILDPIVKATKAQFIFEGNFNPMMAMMIKSPISKFLDVLIQKLSIL